MSIEPAVNIVSKAVDHAHALQDVSYDVHAGQVLGVLDGERNTSVDKIVKLIVYGRDGDTEVLCNLHPAHAATQAFE